VHGRSGNLLRAAVLLVVFLPFEFCKGVLLRTFLSASQIQKYKRTVVIAAVMLTAVCALVTGRVWPVEAAQDSSGENAAMAALGRQIFFDPSLSASGKVSCATCHDPAHAYGPPNGLAVQLGGAEMNRQGERAVPSLRYVLNRTQLWHKEFVPNLVERIREGDEPPKGGFGWDGRFKTLREQAEFPLLSPNEMANASVEDIAAKLRRASYAGELRRVFGARVLESSADAYAAALAALERFELDDVSFHPYASKYDDYLDGKAQLSSQERRGLALFDDPKRGNCASCHLDRKGANGSHPLFTDYEFEALGVPRNKEILANGSASYFDMGLCGPIRGDQAAEKAYCGLFKTPSLRNVATRAVFFHNGRFHTLKDALRFYVERDTDPKAWYGRDAAGAVVKFDDLPQPLRANVDVVDEPLTRKEGGEPAWSEAEIDDVAAFLETLTDRDALRVLK
jgi:cytochrome c peroxidase